MSADRASFQARLFVNPSKYLPQVDELEEDKQREWSLEEAGKEHLRNLRSINNQQKNDEANCVAIYLTMPKIPTSLNCLDDCFFNIPASYTRKCEIELDTSATE